jgi:hypothetical protein
MNPPDSPATPPANGHDPQPTPSLQAVTRRLADLRPADPPTEARDRVWQAIASRLDAAETPEQAAGRQLQALRPAGPTAETEKRLWQRLQAATQAGERAPTPPQPRTLTRPTLRPLTRRLALVAALVVLALAVTVNNVAQAALPGESLYPVKRLWEGARLALAVLPDARARVLLDQAEERFDEADALVAQGQAPGLVAQVVTEAVSGLNAAAGQLPSADVEAVAGAGQALADQWPPAYADAAATVVNYLDGGPLPDPLTGPTATATSASTTPPLTHTPLPVDTYMPPTTTTAAPTRTAEPTAAATAQPTTTPTEEGIPATVPPALPSATSDPASTGLPALPSATADPASTALPTLPVGTLLPGATTSTPTVTGTPPSPSATPTLPLPTLTLPPLLPTATRTPTPSGGAGPAASATPILPLPTVTLPVPTITLPVP